MTFKEAQDAGFIQAKEAGKVLQERLWHIATKLWVWEDIQDDSQFFIRLGGRNKEEVRIKPEKKRVPLTMEDLPPVFWVKFPSLDEWVWLLVVGIGVNGVMVATDNRTFDNKALTDLGATWSTDRKTEHPFWKEVEE